MASASDANPLGTDFPGRWMRTKIGRVTTKVGSGATPKGGAVVYQDHGVPLIRSLNVHNDGFRSDDLAFISDNHARQLDYASVEPGDVLLNITGASILRSAIAPPEIGVARVNQHVSILRPNTRVILPEFLHAWLISPIMHSFMYSQNVGSTREAITKEQILRFPVILPSLAEQQSISRYLGTKTAEIDGLIGKLTRQVELLERYRRELIARTVTRGLIPDVPMKDSGIDWVGEIPGNWKTVSLSVITDENRRKNADLAEKNLLSLSYGEIIRKSIDLPFGLLPASFDGYQVVDSGYIILRMTDLQNDKRSLRTGLAHERGIITGAYIGLIPRGAVVSSYLAWLLRFYDLAKVFYSLGGGVRQSANYKEVGKLSVLLPPIEEQQQIADYLDQKNAEIDSTISGIRKQIELLGRYRKQVINDLVTGKVRVEEAL